METLYNNKHTIRAILAALILIIGFLAGEFYGSRNIVLPKNIRENSMEFKFINPLLFSKDITPSSELTDLKDIFQSDTSRYKINNFAKRVSIYFRLMNESRWTGLDENNEYDPSSLLKVLTLISYAKGTQYDNNLLSKKIFYDYKNDPGQYYKPTPLPTGYYTANKLLQQLIVESDNTAMKALNAENAEQLRKVFGDFQLPNILTSEKYTISPQTYSYVFRALYNSGYLSNDGSEEILKLLSFVAFDKGLTAGVDKNIAVAHKFGEHTTTVDGKIQSRELHDCGIIYYPGKPYFLCVMTEGQKFEDLEKVISQISSDVFNYMKQKYPIESVKKIQ